MQAEQPGGQTEPTPSSPPPPPTPDRTKPEIKRLLRDVIGSVSLHRHLEGTFGLPHLREIAADIGVSLQEETWGAIDTVMNSGGERTLPAFINRLSTRWLRLLMIKGINQGQDGKKIMTTVVNKFLQLAQKENIQIIEFLFSPLAFCKEGNLSDMQPFPDGPEEETKAIELFNASFKDKAPTFRDICLAVHEAICESPKCVPFGKEKEEDQMTAGYRICLRRDNIFEEPFLNDQFDSEQAQFFRAQIQEMHQDNVIVGIDIAGVEAVHKLEDYGLFLHFLNENNIPFTVHAAELSQDQAATALDNIACALKYGARRIGHAVRLFDDNSKANGLLEELLEKEPPVYIEFCPTSNLWTGTAGGNLSEHPIIKTLIKNHSLFKDNSQLWARLVERIVICDDDPAIFGDSTTPLADEFTEVLPFVYPKIFSGIPTILAPQHLRTLRTRALKATLYAQTHPPDRIEIHL